MSDRAAANTFEDATTRLAAIVTELEGGDLPLERSLALFEEGVRVARAAQERLDQAERRVEELLGVNAKGEPITRARDVAATPGRRPPRDDLEE
jgi:exodeoxyribonuclease VII small subunit